MSANSSMHEPHQVAQKLINVMCLDGFSRRSFKSSAVAIFSFTGSAEILRRAASLDAVFSFHLVEQPKTPVCFTDTSRFASKASMALRASLEFTISLR